MRALQNLFALASLGVALVSSSTAESLANAEKNYRDTIVSMAPKILEIWAKSSDSCRLSAAECLVKCNEMAIVEADGLIGQVASTGWDERYNSIHKLHVDFIEQCSSKHINRLNRAVPMLRPEIDNLVITSAGLVSARDPKASGVARETQTGIAAEKFATARIALKLKLNSRGLPQLATGL